MVASYASFARHCNSDFSLIIVSIVGAGGGGGGCAVAINIAIAYVC